MKKIVYIVFLLCAVPTYFVQAQTFTRSLSIGTTGDDVLALQKILNNDSNTQVAVSGVGSFNNETTYFGELTKQAVIKFQNKYANEILFPVGLSVGTGYVGPSTLSFLNLIQNKQQTTITTESSTQTNPIVQNLFVSDQPSSANAPQFFISKKTIQSGEKIQIGSQTILKDITFYLNNIKLSSKCFTDYTCQLSVDTKIKPGVYKLKTNNENIGETLITILESSIKIPEVKIKSISMSNENLIKGKNLSPIIKIYTMYGVFMSETQDDSFILSFPTEYTESLETNTKGLFYIENENGLTSDILTVQYEI